MPPGILSGETWWCQGYLEPGAGSGCRFENQSRIDGDEYVVNGHKMDHFGEHADWMFCLVRTSDGKPQEAFLFAD